MALKRRSPHMGDCILILSAVAMTIVLVCSAPLFENNEELNEEKNGANKYDETTVVKLEELRPREKEDQKEDDWGNKFAAHSAEKDSIERLAETTGISAAKGPYLNISQSNDNLGPDDDSSVKHDHAQKFKNWREYLQARRDVNRKIVSNKPVGAKRNPQESGRKPAHRPLMHSDDHFRFIDKLFKEKNYKVKAFHNLVLHKKQQGKKIKTTQRPSRQKTANAGSRSNYDLGTGSTTKLPV